ncbi:peptide deformylase [Streptomyces coelicoflavus]|uniref:peptide deformylase n=1 Tax=Streptomyces coelicoflavus TaxID=285562 RepID=UPI00362F45AA
MALPSSANTKRFNRSSRERGAAQRADAQPRRSPGRRPLLAEPARPFSLPAEREAAEQAVESLFTSMERIAGVHTFAKGMGIVAPQIGISRAAAVVQPAKPGAGAIVLLNPRIIAASQETDDQYEGCLSFFDVRCLVPRPLRITVETTTLDGTTVTTDYERGLARLVQHEIGHLDGHLCTVRMRPGVQPISVTEYRQTGRAWSYEHSNPMLPGLRARGCRSPEPGEIPERRSGRPQPRPAAAAI